MLDETAPRCRRHRQDFALQWQRLGDVVMPAFQAADGDADREQCNRRHRSPRKTRQRPDAISANGNNTPSWGFTVSSPINTPATTGRLSSEANDRKQGGGREQRTLAREHAKQGGRRDQNHHENTRVGNLAAPREIEREKADRKPGGQGREIAASRMAPSRQGLSAGSASSVRDSPGQAAWRVRHCKSQDRRIGRDRHPAPRARTSTGSGNPAPAPR